MPPTGNNNNTPFPKLAWKVWEGGNDHKEVKAEHELLMELFVNKVKDLVTHVNTMVQKDVAFPAKNGSDSIAAQIESRKMLGASLDVLSAMAISFQYSLDHKDSLFTDARKERGATRVQTIHDPAMLAKIRQAGGFKGNKPIEAPKDPSKSARFANLDLDDKPRNSKAVKGHAAISDS